MSLTPIIMKSWETLAAEIAQGKEIYDNIEQFLPIIWKYTDITELNAPILPANVFSFRKQSGKSVKESKRKRITLEFSAEVW